MGSIAHKIAAQIVPVLSSEWAGVTHKIDAQIVPVLSSEWAGTTHKISAHYPSFSGLALPTKLTHKLSQYVMVVNSEWAHMAHHRLRKPLP